MKLVPMVLRCLFLMCELLEIIHHCTNITISYSYQIRLGPRFQFINPYVY